MKVPPKRKGNTVTQRDGGKVSVRASMKVPPKRKGNHAGAAARRSPLVSHEASMKVPPKRKGNFHRSGASQSAIRRLNESPSEKEGKLQRRSSYRYSHSAASMKVPPKRKGNFLLCFLAVGNVQASMKVPPKRKGNSITDFSCARKSRRPQ